MILLQLKVMKELEKSTSRPERMIEDAVQMLDTQLFDVSKVESFNFDLFNLI